MKRSSTISVIKNNNVPINWTVDLKTGKVYLSINIGDSRLTFSVKPNSDSAYNYLVENGLDHLLTGEYGYL